MPDRKIVDQWPGNDEPQDGKEGWRRSDARGLHLQQIVDPDQPEAYSGVGTELRAERQRRQLSLADVAAALRIQHAHLAALEEGRTDDLPGPTYAIGFLRTYSDFLGLDADEIIRRFKREATLAPVERRLVFPEPLEEARRPGLRLALISLLVAGAVYVGWIFLERQGLMPTEKVAEPPSRLAPYQTGPDTAANTEAEKAGQPATSESATESARNTKSTEPATATPPAAPMSSMANTGPQGGSDSPSATASAMETGTSPANEAEIKTADTPATTLPAVSDATAGATAETMLAQVSPPAAESGDAETMSRTAATAKPASGDAARATANDAGEGPISTDVRAAAPEMETGVSIADRPASAQSAAADQAQPASVSPKAVDSVVKPMAAMPAVSPEEAAQAQPAAPAPEGDDVKTALATPLQVVVVPPAAPAAPVRPLTGGDGGSAVDNAARGAADQASQRAALGVPSHRPQAYGASNSNVRIVLRARAESWVQVQGANNELLLTRMLRAGDSYRVPNRDGLLLMTGNAGAIEVIVDGVLLGALGPDGQVRRDIPLDPAKLRSEPPTNNTSSP